METLDDRLIATHLGDDYDRFMGAVVPPVFMNSLHVFPTMEQYLQCDPKKDFIYGRIANPTVRLVEQKIAALERGKTAALFASGMAAATTAIAAVCKAGAHIICLRNCYGPVIRFLDEYCVGSMGMSVDYVPANAEDIIGAIQPETRLMVLESPTSLVFEVIDLRKIAKAAREKGIITYVDNTYCTPLFQKPLDMGIDIVMHTLSKYLGGHSDIIGGVLVCNDDALSERLLNMRILFGGIIGPQEAWLVMRGIRTLDVRLAHHQETALAVAKFLESHPKVLRVNYPALPVSPHYTLATEQQSGCTGLLSFELEGDKEDALRFCNRLQLFKIGVSWGGFESLVVLPMYKHAPEDAAYYGANDKLVRIHCGLEGADNLIEDLRQALL